MPKDRLEKHLLTSVGKALCYLYVLSYGGSRRVRRYKLTEVVGGQYGYAIHELLLLGLVLEHEDKTIELTEKGKKLAECICRCLDST